LPGPAVLEGSTDQPPMLTESSPGAGEGAGAAHLTPRLKLAYRRFSFAHIGAKGTSGPASAEPFDVLSVDFYPVSSSVRFGLTGQYGWQEGTFRENGDAFFAGAVSLGGQI